MKAFLTLLFLTSFSSQIEITKLYQPKELPRGQFYEVAYLNQVGTGTDADRGLSARYCLVQYLAVDYRKSFWGVVAQVGSEEKEKDCLEILDSQESMPFLKKYESSEILKVVLVKASSKKKELHIMFTTKQGELKWIFQPWNFLQSEYLKISSNNSSYNSGRNSGSKSLEEMSPCLSYTSFPKCELIQEEQEDCRQCASGWRYTVGSGCQHAGKICAQNCGDREQVACPQGRVKESDRMNLVCPNQVEGAICHKGLSAFCYENVVYCK